MRLERFLLPVVLALALGACATPGNTGFNTGAANFHPPANVDPKDAARTHTELAQRYMRQGRLKAALKKLQIAVKFDHDYAPAHTLLAVLYERIGELDKAGAQYRRALDLEPKDGSANNNYGAFLCKKGEHKKSLAYFHKALADPFYQTPDRAWSNAGICAMKIPDDAMAIADFRKALKINPKNADALYRLAAIFYKKNDAFRASAFLQRFDALQHPSPQSLALGYRIATRLGDAEGARTYLEKLQSKFPDSEQAQSLQTHHDSK